MGKAQIINCVVYVWAFVLTLLLPWVFTTNISGSGSCPVHEFHGGNPNGFASGLGSCFCGKDSYCLCTPSLAIDAIVEVKSILNEVSVVLVVRKDSTKKQYAIPGGFVNVGETVENAALREVHEETNLILDESSLRQYYTESNPKRDYRRHTVSVVFRCITDIIMNPQNPTTGNSMSYGDQFLHSGDDAKAVEVVPLRNVLNLNLAFDHKDILRKYIAEFHHNHL